MTRRKIKRFVRRWAAIGVFAALVLLGALLVRGLWSFVSGGPAEAGGAGAAPASPALTFAPSRHVPLPPHPNPARVNAALAPLFTDDVFAHAGIAVVAEDGTLLYGHNAMHPLAPASTMKLLVGATSLNRFGSRYRFVTELLSEAPPREGTIEGPLWLVGSGDPLFTHDDLRSGVGSLAHAGIRRVTGGVNVDAAAFVGPEQNPTWLAEDLGYDYGAGESAVSLDQGTVEFDVTPGAPGEAAHVRVVPSGDGVRVNGAIRTVGAGTGTLLSIQLATPDPAHPGNRFDVGGYIAAGETQRYWEPVHDLARYAGFVLLSALTERGIATDEKVQLESAPLAGNVLWRHRSQPLDATLRDMLVNSNNHTAEQLLRALGAQAGNIGSIPAGAGVERAELQRLGVPAPGLRIIDGSGLSPQDRIAPLTQARLVAAELHEPEGNRFVRQLPLVGLEGTVRYHQLSAALGKARAKSGHIGGVNALAGMVRTAHHGYIAFSIIVNDPRAYDEDVTDGQDRMMDALARL